MLPIAKSIDEFVMDINFHTGSLEKLVNSQKKLTREFGSKVARAIMMRMATLKAAPCLEQVPHTPPERRHQLTGNRKGQFAVDANKASGVRVVFKPNHNPLPTMDDGGIDLSQVTKIVILEVDDYHD
jgi:proteic killer suppression protein